METRWRDDESVIEEQGSVRGKGLILREGSGRRFFVETWHFTRELGVRT